MLVLEIPYGHAGAQWHVDGLPEGREDFASRVEAVAFAMKIAQRHTQSQRPACICIQGADGTWRTFDANMMPIPQASFQSPQAVMG